MANIVILPSRNELGVTLMHVVRWVNRLAKTSPTSLVVCCRRGDELLYPGATSYYYDWADVEDARKNGRLWRDQEQGLFLEQLRRDLEHRYPGHEILEPPKRRPHQPEHNFIPRTNFHYPHDLDVVLAPRYRQHGQHRNYQHWVEVAQGLVDKGFAVGAIGASETSVRLPCVPDTHCSWAWHPTSLEPVVAMMGRARLVLSTDSGMAHLAVLCQRPLKIIYDAPNVEAGKPEWPWQYPHMRAHATTHCEPILWGWHQPELVVNSVADYLSTTS